MFKNMKMIQKYKHNLCLVLKKNIYIFLVGNTKIHESKKNWNFVSCCCSNYNKEMKPRKDFQYRTHFGNVNSPCKHRKENMGNNTL